MSSEALRQRNIERQMMYASSLERGGNIEMSYRIYDQLLRKNDDDINVLRGYLEISLKAGKIKQCETVLKDLLSRHPLKTGYIDPDNPKEIFPVQLIGVLAEFFFKDLPKKRSLHIF
ncbi:MAG: hypothetical protein R6V47_00460 [Candidatus Delongbacteria bacterium]